MAPHLPNGCGGKAAGGLGGALPGGASGSQAGGASGSQAGGASGNAAGDSSGGTNDSGGAGGDASGGVSGALSGGAGQGGVAEVLAQEHVRWIGQCTPVGLSDDAHTVLALEGLWTETTGWTPLPDLPGGDESNTPVVLSGNGRVVYGSSGSPLGKEIYRFDVESGVIQGVGELYLGEPPTYGVPETVRAIDTNQDGNVLVGYGFLQPMGYFRWTPSGGFAEILPLGPFGEIYSVVLSSNAETAVFSPISVVSSVQPALVSFQFGGSVVFPVGVSGDGKSYSMAGVGFGPAEAARSCLPRSDQCQGSNQAIFDLDYDGRAGVGREYWGRSGPREPVGTFYWSSPDRVRYLHEALYDNGVFVDTEILSRAAISADGRSVLGTATRHFVDGSSHSECFIAEFAEPSESTAPEKIVEVASDSASSSALFAGAQTNCARGADGEVRCWGSRVGSSQGRQVRDGWSALNMASLAGALDLALTTDHGCAVLADHSVRCWGDNGAGQLGNGTRVSSATPVEVVGIDDAVQVAVTEGGSCAVRLDGGLACWGEGGALQWFERPLLTPRVISGVPPVRNVALSSYDACVTTTDDGAWCWGFSLAVVEEVPEPLVGREISQMSMSRYGNWCAVTPAGGVVCDMPSCCSTYQCTPTLWPQYQGGFEVQFSKPVAEVSVGNFHFCALLSDGTVECAGYGRSGELGTTDRTFCQSAPAAVPGLAGVVHIASGSDHTCALLASGEVRCWGLDDAGQLGIGFAYTNTLAATELSPGISHPTYVRRGTD